MRKSSLALLSCIFLAGTAQAQEGSFQTKSLTPETALTAAKAALESCRKQGYQVGVAIVDRSGRLAANVEGNQFTPEQFGDLLRSVVEP